MSGQTEIFVRLLNEGIAVWLPIRAEHIRGNIYRIGNQPYDEATETWEFRPGSYVECELTASDGGRILAATRKVVGAGSGPP